MLCNGPTNRPHAYKGCKRKDQRKLSNLILLFRKGSDVITLARDRIAMIQNEFRIVSNLEMENVSADTMEIESRMKERENEMTIILLN